MSAMYNFLFDRKSLTLLLCGFVVGGGLLFFSGVLVGVYWSLPYGTEIQAGVPPARPLPRPALAPVPAPAALPQPAPPPAISFPAAPAPEPPGPVAAADETIGMPKAAPVAPALPPAPLPRPRHPLSPRPEPAPLEAAVPAGEGRYTVQVGAFSQLENSQATVAQLARRGYEPYVVEVQTARGSVLHMVRLGRYPDRGAAARAAADLRRKERMEAIVQRVSPGVAGTGAEKAAATS